MTRLGRPVSANQAWEAQQRRDNLIAAGVSLCKACGGYGIDLGGGEVCEDCAGSGEMHGGVLETLQRTAGVDDDGVV